MCLNFQEGEDSTDSDDEISSDEGTDALADARSGKQVRMLFYG
jgi:hypothetical protein